MPVTKRSRCAGMPRVNCTRTADCRFVTSTKRSDYCRIKRRSSTPHAPVPTRERVSPTIAVSQIIDNIPVPIANVRRTRKSMGAVMLDSSAVTSVIAAELEHPNNAIVVSGNGVVNLSKAVIPNESVPDFANAINDIANSHVSFNTRIGLPIYIDASKL